MIVTDKNVTDALAYLSQDPHPVALAKKDLTDAENRREKIFAELFRACNDKTVREKETFVETCPTYREAKDEESEAAMEHERHRARVRAAEMLIEVWRSENANARAAERVR
jgi:hypothetical protein